MQHIPDQSSQIFDCWSVWKGVLNTLENADISTDCRQTSWLDYLTGRNSDSGRSNHTGPIPRQPGFLFWSAVRTRLAGIHHPEPFVEELRQQKSILHAAADIVLGENLQDVDAAEQSKVLIDAAIHVAASVTYAVCSVSAEQQAQQIDALRDRANAVWQHFRQAVRSYSSFWNGDVLSEFERLLPPSWSPATDVNLACHVTLVHGFISWIHDKLDGVPWNIHVPLAMAARAWTWLAGQPNAEDPASECYSMWVLFCTPLDQECARLLGERMVGSCALVEMQQDAVSLRSPCYPDPIMLGILPFDELWKTSFDRGLTFLAQSKSIDQVRSFRWTLNFLSVEDASQVAETFLPRSASLTDITHIIPAWRRPHALCGDSASAAFTCLLSIAHDRRIKSTHTQFTVVASVYAHTEAGESKLHPVGNVLTKLDKRLWTQMLFSELQVAFIHQDDETIWTHGSRSIQTRSFGDLSSLVKAAKSECFPTTTILRPQHRQRLILSVMLGLFLSTAFVVLSRIERVIGPAATNEAKFIVLKPPDNLALLYVDFPGLALLHSENSYFLKAADFNELCRFTSQEQPIEMGRGVIYSVPLATIEIPSKSMLTIETETAGFQWFWAVAGPEDRISVDPMTFCSNIQPLTLPEGERQTTLAVCVLLFSPHEIFPTHLDLRVEPQ